VLENGRISIISYYWDESPEKLLAKVRVIKENPNAGYQLDCFIQKCVI